MRVLLLLLLCYQESLVEAPMPVVLPHHWRTTHPPPPDPPDKSPSTEYDITTQKARKGGILSFFLGAAESLIEGASAVIKEVGKGVVETAKVAIKVTAGATILVVNTVGKWVPGLRVLSSIANEVIPEVAGWLEVAVDTIGNTIIASISESLCETMKTALNGRLLTSLPRLFTKLASNLVVDVCIDLAALAIQKTFPELAEGLDSLQDIMPNFLSSFGPVLEEYVLPVIGEFSSKAEKMLKKKLFKKMLPGVKKMFPKKYQKKADWVSDYNKIIRYSSKFPGRSLESYEGSLVFLKSTEMTVWTNKWDI